MATNTAGELKKVDEVVAQLRKEFDLEREREPGQRRIKGRKDSSQARN